MFLLNDLLIWLLIKALRIDNNFLIVFRLKRNQDRHFILMSIYLLGLNKSIVATTMYGLQNLLLMG